MSAPPGWYPDPAGADEQFRYWDGASWSAVTSRHPGAPPPRADVAPGMPAHTGRTRSRAPIGWILGAVAAVLVVALVAVFLVRQITGVDPLRPDPQGPQSSNACPPGVSSEPTAAPQRGDGRVHGGRLSYPELGSPWEAPDGDSRVPFGRQVQQQFATIERGEFLGYDRWGADVLVGELAAGDGFFAPKDGVAIVLRCVTGTFYGDTEVGRDDRRSEAITVDGRPGWIVETQLSFDVPNLQAKRELLMVVVVEIGDGTAGLFLASVPENGPQFVPQARAALAALRIDD